MRVLLIPELYRPDDATANGTLSDLATLAREWLDRDDAVHVYWLVPPCETANYDHADLLADRERVTLVEADPIDLVGPVEGMFTEHGYTAAQLRALEEAIFDRDAFLDVVVDQLRTGRFTLYKWLLAHTDHWAARVAPVDVVANVHDLQLPFKYRYCDYRNEFQSWMEICAALFADGIWFKAGVDAAGMREYASQVLRPAVVDRALDSAVETGSPLDLSGYEERYRTEPGWFHLAGSLWEKKHVEELLSVGETLFERFGVRTLLTSMEDVPDEYATREFVEAHPHASRETYETALRRGDLAVCASEYETMARTPFEQAASGQVLVLRDEPWIYDCMPENHPLVADAEELCERAVWAVEHWDEAVAANRRLVEHVRRVRDPARCGRRTYRDLRRRVDAKTERYEADETEPALERALADFDGRVALDDLVDRTASYTRDGRPLTEDEDRAFVDVVYALRASGYRDTGNPGTPVFRPPADS